MAYKIRNIITLLICYNIVYAESEVGDKIKERYNPVALITVGGRIIKKTSYLDQSPLKVKFRDTVNIATPIIVGHNRLSHFYKLPTSSTLFMERKNQPNLATYYPFGQIHFPQHIVEGDRLIVFLQPKKSKKNLWEAAVVAKMLRFSSNSEDSKVRILNLCKDPLLFKNKQLVPRAHTQFKLVSKNSLFLVKRVPNDLVVEEESIQFQLSPREKIQQIVVFYDVIPEANRGKSVSYFLLNIPIKRAQLTSEIIDQ